MQKRKTFLLILVPLFVICLAFLANTWRNGGALPARAQEADGENGQPVTLYVPLLMNVYTDPPEFADNLFGIEVTPADYLQEIPEVAQAGSAFTRLNVVRWADIEPQQGVRDWSVLAGFEQQLQFAAQNDLQVIVIVRHTPDWAQKTPGAYCGPIKADKLATFGDFLYELVSRYQGAPYFVKYWELYNEPDVAPNLVQPDSPYGCWGDAADPYYGGGYFAEMLKVAYPKIKQADPEAQVITGGVLLSCNPASGKCVSDEEITASKFFEGILANQGGDYFDVAGFHNYDFYLFELGTYFSRKWDSYWDTTGPAVIAKANFLKDLMEAYGVSGKSLMNTETALLCGPADVPPEIPGCEGAPNAPFELTKAHYIAQTYAAAIAEGLSANIWYNLSGWRNSGLVYADLSPRPAYTAYQFAREKLEEAVYLGPIESQDTGGETNVQGYKYQRPDGGQVWIIWSLNRTPQTISLTTSPDSAWNVFGSTVALDALQTLTIPMEPRYIEWNP